MYLLPWRNAIHQTDFCRRGHCVYETVLLAGKRCFMDFMSLSPEMFEVYFSAEKNKSSAIKRWFKNDLVACSLSAADLLISHIISKTW